MALSFLSPPARAPRDLAELLSHPVPGTIAAAGLCALVLRSLDWCLTSCEARANRAAIAAAKRAAAADGAAAAAAPAAKSAGSKAPSAPAANGSRGPAAKTGDAKDWRAAFAAHEKAAAAAGAGGDAAWDEEEDDEGDVPHDA
jgi:hypothetical protein